MFRANLCESWVWGESVLVLAFWVRITKCAWIFFPMARISRLSLRAVKILGSMGSFCCGLWFTSFRSFAIARWACRIQFILPSSCFNSAPIKIFCVCSGFSCAVGVSNKCQGNLIPPSADPLSTPKVLDFMTSVWNSSLSIPPTCEIWLLA